MLHSFVFSAEFYWGALKRDVLVQNAVPAGRHHVHDTVSASFEFAQERRQHLGGLRLCVVKQHDTPADLVDPAELAQTSAPKTTRLRSFMRSSNARVDAKPGNRKNGMIGVVRR